MKAILLLTLSLVSFSSFSADKILDLSNLRILTVAESNDLRAAAISVNNNEVMFGSCNLGSIDADYNKVYINDKGITPLIVIVNESRDTFITLSTDDTMTKLISGTRGFFDLRRVNAQNSTLKKPILKTVHLITSSTDCIQ